MLISADATKSRYSTHSLFLASRAQKEPSLLGPRARQRHCSSSFHDGPPSPSRNFAATSSASASDASRKKRQNGRQAKHDNSLSRLFSSTRAQKSISPCHGLRWRSRWSSEVFLTASHARRADLRRQGDDFSQFLSTARTMIAGMRQLDY